jgi:hypothetical protein
VFLGETVDKWAVRVSNHILKSAFKEYDGLAGSLKETVLELNAEADAGLLNLERTKLVVETVYNRMRLAMIKRGTEVSIGQLKTLSERAQVLKFLFDLKIGAFEKPADYGMQRSPRAQAFVDGFCRWYTAKHGLTRPELTVWVCWSNGVFKPVLDYMTFSSQIDPHNAVEIGRRAEYGSERPPRSWVAAECWTINVPLELGMLKPLFRTRNLILLHCDNYPAEDNTMLKPILTHEVLHAIEYENGITLIKRKTRNEVGRVELWRYLAENPAQARETLELEEPSAEVAEKIARYFKERPELDEDDF